MGIAAANRVESPRPARPRERMPIGGCSLLDLDPDLGQLLEEPRHTAARTELLVRRLTLSRGSWAGGELSSASPAHVGLLVIEGAIAREVALADTISTELLGPGDLIRPWSPEPAPPLLGRQVRWQVLAEARLAVLNRAFGVAVLRYPEINSMLLDRLNRRAERLATMKAITQLNTVDRRLLALFWYLAEDWGRMTIDGVLVPLAISHRLLGELVGARRPTVSTAAAKLATDGKLVRRCDGTWLLPADRADGIAATAAQPMISHRRRLLADLSHGDGHAGAALLGALDPSAPGD
jgi:CRP/FNR family transcriptional regulator, cyclic AMP receptor protein